MGQPIGITGNRHLDHRIKASLDCAPIRAQHPSCPQFSPPSANIVPPTACWIVMDETGATGRRFDANNQAALSQLFMELTRAGCIAAKRTASGISEL
jgi:hypothetical protein